LPILLLAACVGGGAWALIPGILKAKRGAHEVISTMMMNFVALAATNYLISAHFHEPETIHTAELPDAAALSLLEKWIPSLAGSPLNTSLLVAIVLAIAVRYFLWDTPFGFELRAVGMNPEAARTSGVPVEKRWLQILVIS